MVLSIGSYDFIFESSAVNHKDKLYHSYRNHNSNHPFFFLRVPIRMRLILNKSMLVLQSTTNIAVNQKSQTQRIRTKLHTLVMSCLPDSNNICSPRVAIMDANTTRPWKSDHIYKNAFIKIVLYITDNSLHECRTIRHVMLQWQAYHWLHSLFSNWIEVLVWGFHCIRSEPQNKSR